MMYAIDRIIHKWALQQVLRAFDTSKLLTDNIVSVSIDRRNTTDEVPESSESGDNFDTLVKLLKGDQYETNLTIGVLRVIECMISGGARVHYTRYTGDFTTSFIIIVCFPNIKLFGEELESDLIDEVIRS